MQRENSKKGKDFKVYALSYENFERIACKSAIVYVANLRKVTQTKIGAFSSWEVVASGRNELGDVVEMIIDCGGGFAFQDEDMKRAIERSERVLEMVKNRLEESGFEVQEGRVSNEPVYASFFEKGGER